jgi:hypothetical protein
MNMVVPQLSVVVPVYNEEAGLSALFDRLYPALDHLGVAYEVVFVDDGSRDRSAAVLKDQFLRRPDVTRVIMFHANYGQHMAIVAAFDHCRGERIITLDAEPAGGNRQASGCHGCGPRLRREHPPHARGFMVAARRFPHDEPRA